MSDFNLCPSAPNDVRRIVDSYQGILETEEKNNHFIVSVITEQKLKIYFNE